MDVTTPGYVILDCKRKQAIPEPVRQQTESPHGFCSQVPH